MTVTSLETFSLLAPEIVLVLAFQAQVSPTTLLPKVLRSMEDTAEVV